MFQHFFLRAILVPDYCGGVDMFIPVLYQESLDLMTRFWTVNLLHCQKETIVKQVGFTVVNFLSLAPRTLFTFAGTHKCNSCAGKSQLGSNPLDPMTLVDFILKQAFFAKQTGRRR